ncbi:hypothetical protein C1H46_006029 [Malus baccata]|uniref:Uncharacterized protein n=1 Tax=Malus baccata TaxID=106549 RepID=A0A540NBI7_MALBA|nr:hypothetical protein C1H46_006029 [Malus baccata]
MLNESFFTNDRLHRGKSPPHLGFQNKAFKGEEYSMNVVPLVDPKCVSSAFVSRSFWSSVYLLPKNFLLSHYIANKARVGCISKVYMTYWMKCFKAIAKFHGDKQPKLHFCIFNHPRLVLDNATAYFGLKWRCPSMAEDNNVPGDSSQSVKKSRASCDCGGKFSKNLVFCGLDGKVKHFRPKVAKYGHLNSRKFVDFGIPKESNSKSVSAKLKISSGFSGIVFLFLACSSTTSQLHANRVSSL